ncbi:MAG: hypothetical protein ACRDOK_28035 [Streptosporangiaceae bacterium]
MSPHRRIPHILGSFAIVALAVTVTACGSSGPSSPSTSKPPVTSAPVSPTATGNAVSQITANWEAFFSAQTPTSQRVSLLQDGSQFQSIIQAQAGGGLASQASAKVTNVTVNSPTQATVKYNILISGTPALTGQTGTAVFENGSWKVGVSSFCGLLSLENAGKTTGLPVACQSA